jgi:hypothetical protein
MRHHLRVVVIFAAGLVTYGLLIMALRLMSQPSDLSLYSGIGLILGLMLLFPLLVRTIWRKL